VKDDEFQQELGRQVNQNGPPDYSKKPGRLAKAGSKNKLTETGN